MMGEINFPEFFFFVGKMWIIVSVIFPCIISHLQVSSNEGFPAFSVET